MGSTVVGLFDTHLAAQETLMDLERVGFVRDQVSVATSDGDGHFAAPGGAGDPLLVHLQSVGAMIHDPSQVILSGPIAGAIAGASRGTQAGGPLGALMTMGVPGEAASLYAEAVRRGATLVGISVTDIDAPRAQAVLDRHGSIDVDTRMAYLQTRGYQTYDPTARAYSAQQAMEEASDFHRFVAQRRAAGHAISTVRSYTGAYADRPSNYVVDPAPVTSTVTEHIERVADDVDTL